MAITAADVNKLRQMTGAGMMDCKNALVESDGNIEEAVDILRKKGQKIAAKRSDRDANEGFVYSMTTADHTYGALLMLNCETDFVAKTNDFVNFAKAITELAITKKIKTVEELYALPYNGATVEAATTELTGKTGEKIQVSHFESLEAGFVSSYNHNGNRLATLVGFNKNVDKLETVGHEIAMQIAAMSPIAVDQEHVNADVIAKELEIARDTTRQEGKPEEMVEKISQGKLNKFLKENTLVNQEFIRDNKKTVGQYIKETSADLVCVDFKRLQLGA